MEGRIVFNNRSSVIGCTVRDISSTGAQISFAEALKIPPEVELEIPRTGQRFIARVVRLFGHSHGLMFTNIEAPVPAPSSTPAQPVSTTVVTSDIQAVIQEARHRIAQMAGVAPDAVRLKLEIDY
jgi:hypothetical protein